MIVILNWLVVLILTWRGGSDSKRRSDSDPNISKWLWSWHGLMIVILTWRNDNLKVSAHSIFTDKDDFIPYSRMYRSKTEPGVIIGFSFCKMKIGSEDEISYILTVFWKLKIRLSYIMKRRTTPPLHSAWGTRLILVVPNSRESQFMDQFLEHDYILVLTSWRREICEDIGLRLRHSRDVSVDGSCQWEIIIRKLGLPLRLQALGCGFRYLRTSNSLVQHGDTEASVSTRSKPHTTWKIY